MLFIIITVVLASCGRKKDEGADVLLAQIEHLYSQGHFCQALDSITVLRDRYPQALQQRERALRIWQEASLKMAQNDVMKTDSLLQVNAMQLEMPGSLLTKNKLRWTRDSLKGRYDAMCGVVRMIKRRMSEK